MAVTQSISEEKEDGAIDMMVSMVAEELADELNISVEDALPMFLQSRICATLYDRKSKLWWDGPSCIAEQYLNEISKPK